MKIVSWNVNGIRACLQKGFLDYFYESDADIFCIQESKCKSSQISFRTPNYCQYWSSAEKAGYSGTALFSKVNPIKVFEGMREDFHNHEGRLISAEYENFFLVNVYVPNSQNELRRLDYRMQWESDFLSHIKMLEEYKPVIICGDLNVAHNPIDLARPESNHFSAGFSDEERDCFQKLLDTGYTDAFRKCYPNTKDAYSYWSYMFNARENNTGWRIDYFVVSNKISDKIIDVKMRKDILGSDHGPIELTINI